MKNEETQKIVVGGEAEKGKRVLLSTPCEIREMTIPSFEIDLPEVVMTVLMVYANF